jgi:hypothetical protein
MVTLAELVEAEMKLIRKCRARVDFLSRRDNKCVQGAFRFWHSRWPVAARRSNSFNFSTTNAQTYAQEEARYESNGGKMYWIAGVLRFCPVPDRVNTKCQGLGDGHLKVDGIKQGITETAAGNLPARERYYRTTVASAIF